jgi:hypothetical protein
MLFRGEGYWKASEKPSHVKNDTSQSPFWQGATICRIPKSRLRLYTSLAFSNQAENAQTPFVYVSFFCELAAMVQCLERLIRIFFATSVVFPRKRLDCTESSQFFVFQAMWRVGITA